MKVKIAVPPWVVRDLLPFDGTRVRLTNVRVTTAFGDVATGGQITLVVSDKAVAHPPAAGLSSSKDRTP